MPMIALAVVVGILAAGFFQWRSAIERWRSGQSLLPASNVQVGPWGVVDLAAAILIYLVANFAVIAAMKLAEQWLRMPTPASLPSLDPASQKILLLFSGLATLGTCLLLAVFLWARHRVPWRELGWDPQHLWEDIRIGCKAFVMLVPIVYAIQMLLTQFMDSKHPLIEMLKKNPDPEFFAVAGFAAVIVAPVAEEFLFRVLLQGWLERFFAKPQPSAERLVFGGRDTPTVNLPGPFFIAEVVADPESKSDLLAPADAAAKGRVPAENAEQRPICLPAIVVSSVCFALSHWSHGPDPIPLFVFALGLGYLFNRTQRIVPAIVLHLLLNLCSLLALAMAVAQ